MTESAIQSAIRQAVNLDGRARIVRNAVGYAADTKVRYGLGVGSADLVGILVGSGRVFALEVKTPIGRLRPEQKAWLAAVRQKGGFAAVVRSPEEALAALERALQGLSE